MKILIQNGRVIDPASGFDQMADLAIAAGRVVAMGKVPADFAPNRVIDAKACIVAPGLVDLASRLREPGQEHAGMLESEMAAAVAGGVTSLVCPPRHRAGARRARSGRDAALPRRKTAPGPCAAFGRTHGRS